MSSVHHPAARSSQQLAYIISHNGHSQMAENYTVGVPAAWQQQQENRRSRGAPAEAKFGEGAVHLAAQGAE